jgi:hypothetical protein
VSDYHLQHCFGRIKVQEHSLIEEMQWYDNSAESCEKAMIAITDFDTFGQFVIRKLSLSAFPPHTFHPAYDFHW